MSSKNTARAAREAFAEGAISLLRRALADGLGARIIVDPHGVETHADLFDGDGVVHLTQALHVAQLALPLAGPVEAAPSQPPPVAPTAPVVEAPTARVWIAEAEWDALDGGMQHYLCGVALRGDACGTAPVPIDWQGAVGFIVARAPVGEVLDELVATLRDAGIEHHVGDEAPVATPVEEPPPVAMVKPAAKKPRAKKAAAKDVEPSPVDEAIARPGLWLLVEHPVGAAPVEMRHEEHLARRFFEATAKHGGEDLRRVELFDDMGLLVDSHNFATAPMQRGRTADEIPASVPTHLRDLAALTSPDWWCVVVQQAVRPDLTETKLCTDESTAVATAERARLEDDSANTATRIVTFTATGEVHDAWHRWAPAQSTVVEAHPDAELFRVATPMTDAFSDVTLWAPARGMAWFASGHQRNSPAEVREGDAWVLWGRQNSDAVAIIPRALVVLVERRAAGWKLDLAIEPWTASAECSALRVGSRVEVRGEEWRVFLLSDHETATLTRGDDELATVALAEVHPSGTAAGWWAERTLPKKAEKAPKRAKAVA
jgi:hypothetical protein